VTGNLGRDASSETIQSFPREPRVDPAASPPARRKPSLVTLLVIAGLAVGVLITLPAVLGGDDEVVPTPLPTSAAPSPPTTSSTTSDPPTPEEAAIVSAEAVYRDYLRVSDDVTTAGDGEVAAFAAVAVGEALTQAQVAAENYRLAGIRRVGGVELASLTASAVNLASDPPEVVLDACLDVSDTDLIGPDGESVTSPDDPERLAVTAFVREYPDRGGWLVARIVAQGQSC
jgi:hypothetical protein